MKKITSLFCFIFCLIQFGSTQENKALGKDLVVLKNGSRFVGTLLEYNHTSHVLLQTKFTDPIRLDMNIVEKVLQDIPNYTKPFQYDKVYYNIDLGTPINSEGSFGQEAAFTVIKQWSRWMGFGAGFSYVHYKDDYWRSTRVERLPVYFAYKAYLREGRIAPFLQLNAGYAFNLHDDGYRDGTFVYPKIGFQFGSDDIMFNFYLGAHFTKSDSEFVDEPWGSWERIQTLRRSTFGIGVTF